LALSIESLISALTVEQVRDSMYGILTSLGFPVTSWRPGAKARTIISLVANIFAPFTALAVIIAKSGFLDFATGDALTLLAKQFYNVDRVVANFAMGQVTLDNGGLGVYGPFEPFEVTFQNSTTGKTYQNTESFSLGASETGKVVAIQAVEIGADSAAAATEVDTIVTTMVGVTCSNASTVVGLDTELDPDLRSRCRAKLSALSPNGARDAYDYVARTPELVGGAVVTRTGGDADSNSGDVTLYIAGPAGAVGSEVVDLVQAGIDKWCVPICTDAEVRSAENVTINVTCTVYVYADLSVSTQSIQDRVEQGLTEYFKTIPIGGHVSTVWNNALIGAIAKLIPEAFRVSVSTSDTALDLDQVAVLGPVTTNVTQVSA
jgi:hypothetical protein